MLKNSSHSRCGWPAALAILIFCSVSQSAEKEAVVVAPGDSLRVIVRDSAESGWHLTDDKDALKAGSSIIGGLGATIESANGSGAARLTGDLGEQSPFPILETALQLQESKEVDFAFEMDRGRVDLVNQKKAGAAKIRVTIRGRTGEITLKQPGAELIIEMYSRWPKGVRFTKTPTPADVPSLNLICIAVKGDIQLQGKERTYALSAPPGPAMLSIDGLSDQTPEIQTLDRLPPRFEEKDEAVIRRIQGCVKRFRAEAQKSSIGDALLKMSGCEDENARQTAVILLGALDDLPRLAAAMATAKYADVSDNGILIFRNWIGRGAGQDLKLYNALMEKAHFKPAEAETALQLLHSFSDADLKKPETFEALISYLGSDRPFIRGLAHWHLARLAPDGRKFGFKATASQEERDKAIKAWQQLVPSGTVPQRSSSTVSKE